MRITKKQIIDTFNAQLQKRTKEIQKELEQSKINKELNMKSNPFNLVSK